MKSKTYNLLLIITSLFGYLEWGGNRHSFLFQAEIEILLKLFSDPKSSIHLLIILPLLGQVLLFLSLFQIKPNKILSYIGISGIGILLILMFVIGLISLNYKIIISTIPFLFVSILAIKHYRKIQ